MTFLSLFELAIKSLSIPDMLCYITSTTTTTCVPSFIPVPSPHSSAVPPHDPTLPGAEHKARAVEDSLAVFKIMPHRKY